MFITGRILFGSRLIKMKSLEKDQQESKETSLDFKSISKYNNKFPQVGKRDLKAVINLKKIRSTAKVLKEKE